MRRLKDETPASLHIQAQHALNTAKVANALVEIHVHSLTVYLNAIYILVAIALNFAPTGWHATDAFAFSLIKNANYAGFLKELNYLVLHPLQHSFKLISLQKLRLCKAKPSWLRRSILI